MSSSPYSPLSTLSRYLLGQFVSIFRTGHRRIRHAVRDHLTSSIDWIFSWHQATVDAATRYFFFKIPLMLTQITPPAVIVSVLLSLGLLSRRNEIIALRASGVSLGQTAVPLVLVSVGISLLAFGWNETVVPYSSRKFQYVSNIEIRKRDLRGILSEREIWYHGGAGFITSTTSTDPPSGHYGLVIYRFDDEFHLRRRPAHSRGSLERRPLGFRRSSFATP